MTKSIATLKAKTEVSKAVEAKPETTKTVSVKAKTSKPETAAAAPAAVAPVVVASPVVAVQAEAAAEGEAAAPKESVTVTIEALVAQVEALGKATKTITTELRKLQKSVEKELKESQKKGKKKEKNLDKPKRTPSGFAKPAPISVELCEFLGKPAGTEIARTDVTKALTQYIKTNSLQQPDNKRIILPDAKLKKLLKLKADDVVTYFNLQKYMKSHFPKAEVVATA